MLSLRRTLHHYSKFNHSVNLDSIIRNNSAILQQKKYYNIEEDIKSDDINKVKKLINEKNIKLNDIDEIKKLIDNMDLKIDKYYEKTQINHDFIYWMTCSTFLFCLSTSFIPFLSIFIGC